MLWTQAMGNPFAEMANAWRSHLIFWLAKLKDHHLSFAHVADVCLVRTCTNGDDDDGVCVNMVHHCHLPQKPFLSLCIAEQKTGLCVGACEWAPCMCAYWHFPSIMRSDHELFKRTWHLYLSFRHFDESTGFALKKKNTRNIRTTKKKETRRRRIFCSIKIQFRYFVCYFIVVFVVVCSSVYYAIPSIREKERVCVCVCVVGFAMCSAFHWTWTRKIVYNSAEEGWMDMDVFGHLYSYCCFSDRDGRSDSRLLNVRTRNKQGWR